MDHVLTIPQAVAVENKEKTDSNNVHTSQLATSNSEEESITTTTTNDQPLVTGRKAARSLRLFRGDAIDLGELIDLEKKQEEDEQDKLTSPIKPEVPHTPDPQGEKTPVSSATYFPHTPAEDETNKGGASSISTPNPTITIKDHDQSTTLEYLPNENLTKEVTQRLTADVEFDHSHNGEITKIQRGLKDFTMKPGKNKKNVKFDKQVFPLAVELRPFKNKVGGHTAIFRFSRKAVCKALMNRENLWYEAVEFRHPELLKYMPKYIGVLNVRYSSIINEEQEESPPTPMSSPKIAAENQEDDLPPEVVLDDNRHMIPELLWKQYSPLIHEYLEENHKEDDANLGSTSINTDLQAQVIQEVFPTTNDEMFTMDEDIAPANMKKHTRFERFILLEDLTADMNKPCALDLKMGTRQYGVEANERKQKLQRLKCKQTTSRKLGVRVCGLQVWELQRQKFFTKDKYFGRQIARGFQFAKILAKYLYDGYTTHSILIKIPGIINQLQELYQFFINLDGYRMYGLSILLMYDGNINNNSSVKVRIIDFAQLVIKELNLKGISLPPKFSNLPDMGYLRGLTSLITYFKLIFKLLSGHAFVDPQNAASVLRSNHYKTTCKWLDDYDNLMEDDPFNTTYPEYDDDDGISE